MPFVNKQQYYRNNDNRSKFTLYGQRACEEFSSFQNDSRKTCYTENKNEDPTINYNAKQGNVYWVYNGPKNDIAGAYKSFIQEIPGFLEQLKQKNPRTFPSIKSMLMTETFPRMLFIKNKDIPTFAEIKDYKLVVGEGIPKTFGELLLQRYGPYTYKNYNNVDDVAIKAAAEDDFSKLKGYVTNYFQKLSPVVDDPLAIRGKNIQMAAELEALPTVRQLFNLRKNALEINKHIKGANPLKRSAAKKWLEKFPDAASKDDGFKAIFLTKNLAKKAEYQTKRNNFPTVYSVYG